MIQVPAANVLEVLNARLHNMPTPCWHRWLAAASELVIDACNDEASNDQLQQASKMILAAEESSFCSDPHAL